LIAVTTIGQRRAEGMSAMKSMFLVTVLWP
jgi:hypothetical protein